MDDIPDYRQLFGGQEILFDYDSDDDHVVSNSEWRSSGEQKFIQHLRQHDNGIEGIDNCNQLVAFAFYTAETTNSSQLLKFLLKEKVRYMNQCVSHRVTDKFISQMVSGLRWRELSDRVHKIIDMVLRYTPSSLGLVLRGGGNYTDITVQQMCTLDSEGCWREGYEEALMLRLDEGAIIPNSVAENVELLHYAVRMALETGSTLLLSHALEKEATVDNANLMEFRRELKDIIIAFCKDCTDGDRKLQQTEEVVDLLFTSDRIPLKPEELNVFLWKLGEKHPLAVYLLQEKLDSRYLIDIIPSEGSHHGYERELARRLKDREVEKCDVTYQGSFWFYVVHRTLSTGCHVLLTEMLLHPVLCKNVDEYNDAGDTIMDLVMGQELFPRKHRAMCIQVLAMFDGVDMFMKNSKGRGLSPQAIEERTAPTGNKARKEVDRILKRASVFIKNRQVSERKYKDSAPSVRNAADLSREYEDWNYVKLEVEKRLHKAQEYIPKGTNWRPVTFFHRTKFASYWSEVHRRDGVIPKCPKKDYGNRRNKEKRLYGCPLNEIISGSFFIANDESYMFNQTKSPFGDIRLMKPVADFNPENDCRFWFADFYCNPPSKVHYIVIGITKVGTLEDVFCEKYLVELDPKDNNFFEMDQSRVQVTHKCWVYLFCMDRLNVNAWNSYYDPVPLGENVDIDEEHFKRVNKLEKVEEIEDEDGNVIQKVYKQLDGNVRRGGLLRIMDTRCPICSIE